MIYDVHVHFRSVQMMQKALAQAERLDMVLCTNSINLEGSASPNFPSREFVTACNDRTLGLARQHPQRVIPFLVPQSRARSVRLRRIGAPRKRVPGTARCKALGSGPGQQPNCGRHHADLRRVPAARAAAHVRGGYGQLAHGNQRPRHARDGAAPPGRYLLLRPCRR